MDTDGGQTARPEPALADGLSVGPSGELTFTTRAGDIVRGWVGPSGTAHLDFEARDTFPAFTEAELALLKALVDQLRYRARHRQRGHMLTPEAQR